MTVTPRWIAGRGGALLITVLMGSVIVYGAMYLAPGDPAALLVGGSKPSPEALAAVHREFRLDDPLWLRYWRWLTGVLQGDLGVSIANRAPVSQLVAGRIGNSVFLVAYASVFTIAGGLALGATAGWRGGRAAAVNTAVTSVLMAAPTFAVAVVLITVFASGLGWFPVYGAGSGLIDRLWHLTLPAVSLGFAWLAYVANLSQESTRKEARAEHVETARSRGLGEMSILRRHVLRNASGTLLTVSGVSVAGMFASTAVAEQAFGIDGIGALLVRSAARQDVVVVQAIALILIVAFVTLNTLVDVISALLDPRLRAGVS
ncbi:ABC transporter permease [Spirillospora sp. NPDC050679]